MFWITTLVLSVLISLQARISSLREGTELSVDTIDLVSTQIISIIKSCLPWLMITESMKWIGPINSDQS